MLTLNSFVSIALPGGTVVINTCLLLWMRAQEWLPGPREILTAPPEQAVYGVAWLLALSLTVWIALTTLVAVVVYSTRSPAVIRALKWMPLPPIMRMCKRWTGLLLATATMALAGAAGAGVVSPTPLAMGGDQPVSGDHLPAAASPGRSTAFKVAPPVPLQAGGVRTDREVPEHAAATNIPPFRSFRPTVQGPDRSADTSVYTVRPGDDLWSISASHMSRQSSGAPTEVEIRALWRHVIARNRERLRSANPDLIFPGEMILLPHSASGVASNTTVDDGRGLRSIVEQRPTRIGHTKGGVVIPWTIDGPKK